MKSLITLLRRNPSSVPPQTDLSDRPSSAYRRLVEQIAGSGGDLSPSVAAAQRLGRASSAGGVEFIRRSQAGVASGPYPTPACLTPADLEEYSLGTLDAELVSHARECPGCRSLVNSLRPPGEFVEVFQAALADRAALSAPAERVRVRLDTALAELSG